MATRPRVLSHPSLHPTAARARTLSLARSLPRLAVMGWLWLGLMVALMGVSLSATSHAQNLNALINDTGATSASSTNSHTPAPSPGPSQAVTPPTNTTSSAASTQAATSQASASADGDQESFTPANRCPRCALFSAVQKADAGNTCQAVIFQGAASYSVTDNFETSDMLEISASDSCRLSFFNDSPDRSIVLKLDRALRDLILAPSPDLYSGYLLAPRSSIDLIIRPSQLARSIDASNIVTWEDATQVGAPEDSLFKIRVTPN